jgi:TolB protein
MEFMRKIGALIVLTLLISMTQMSLAYEFEETMVSEIDVQQMNPRISGDIIVWEDYRNDPFGGYIGDGIGNPDIYAYNLSSHSEFPICTYKEGDGKRNSSQEYPDIWKNLVVWEDWRNGNADIYIYDLSDKNQSANGTRLTFNDKDQIKPRIWGNYVVWIDYRNGLDGDIYGFNLSTDSNHNGIPDWKEKDFDETLAQKSIFPVCQNSAQQMDVAIYGHMVVWKDYRNASVDDSGPPGFGGTSVGENRDIYGYDIWEKREIRICTEEHNQFQPAIYGDIVVWGDARTNPPSIFGMNLSSGEAFNFSDGNPQSHPEIFGDVVTWVEKSNGTEHVMVAQFGKKIHSIGGNWTQRSPSLSLSDGHIVIVWSDGRAKITNEYGREQTLWKIYFTRANRAPIIRNINTTTNVNSTLCNLTINAYVYDPDGDNITVNVSSPLFGSVSMFDDGDHGDGSAGDGIYGTIVNIKTNKSEFFINVSATDEYGANSESSYTVNLNNAGENQNNNTNNTTNPSNNSNGTNGSSNEINQNPSEILLGILAIIAVLIILAGVIYIIRRKTESEMEGSEEKKKEPVKKKASEKHEKKSTDANGDDGDKS